MSERPTLQHVELPRSVIRIAGPDRRALLQGLVTNDVTRAGPDRAVFAALLSAQGRFLHDFHIVELDEALLLDAEAERTADLIRRLKLYRLRAKAEIEDLSATFSVHAVLGDPAAAGLPAEPGAARPFAGGILHVDARDARLGMRACLPRDAAAAALAGLGSEPAPFEAWDDLRLAIGIPDGARDLPVEKALMIESGYDALNAIDWKKGCYVGQELTARTKYRGLVKRRLVPVDLAAEPPPAPGTAIERAGETVGELRSGRGRRALAMLRLDAAEAGAEGLAAEGVALVPRGR